MQNLEKKMQNLENRANEYIDFNRYDHTYKHRYQKHDFLSVSSLVSDIFPAFDSAKTIKKYNLEKKHNKSAIELQTEWTNKGNLAKELENHENIQKEKIKDEIIDDYYKEISTEIAQFKNWLSDNEGLTIIGQEFILYNNTFRIAGTVDALFYDKNNYLLTLIDWKRSIKCSPKAIAYGKSDLLNLKDNSYSRYSIQLMLYSWLLKNEHDMIISKLKIVVFHTDIESYQEYEIMYDYDLIKKFSLINLKRFSYVSSQ
eukprot:Pgem_evm3s12679